MFPCIQALIVLTQSPNNLGVWEGKNREIKVKLSKKEKLRPGRNAAKAFLSDLHLSKYKRTGLNSLKRELHPLPNASFSLEGKSGNPMACAYFQLIC